MGCDCSSFAISLWSFPPAEGPLCDHVTTWAREKDITLLDLPVSAETAGGAMRRFSGSELSAVGSLEVARSLLLKALCGHTLPVLKLLVATIFVRVWRHPQNHRWWANLVTR